VQQIYIHQKWWDLSKKLHGVAFHKTAGYSIRGLESPEGYRTLRLPEFLDNRHMNMARLSALPNSRLCSQQTFVVLIYVWGWVDPRAAAWPEGLKNPNDPTGNLFPISFFAVLVLLHSLRGPLVHIVLAFIFLYCKIYTTQTPTPMPTAGLETVIQASERPQTCFLDSTATEIGNRIHDLPAFSAVP
jgi:hypothetical protein